ncbi:MAG: hypothetical protein LUG93_11655 [Lachnospiraceae bacterium]|nr:hypothetical protein [Lachnospiraceae bacterium]
MAENNRSQALSDNDLDQVNGGLTVTITGELHEFVEAGAKLSAFIALLDSYNYGAQIKSAVTEYLTKMYMEGNTTNVTIEIYAKDTLVQINGVTICQ